MEDFIMGRYIMNVNFNLRDFNVITKGCNASTGFRDGTQPINITDLDLYYAAIMYGKKLAYQRYHHIGRIDDLRYRCSLVNLLLEPNGNDWIKTEYYESAESTEKAYHSYFIGNIMAFLSSQIIFNMPYVLFYEDYKSICLMNPLAPGRSVHRKPDFLMTDTNQFYILEAKGSSKGSNPEALKRGREQVAEIAYINGNQPELRLVSQAYFSRNALTVDVHDPEGEEAYINVEVSVRKFIEMFYRPLLDILNVNSEVIEINDSLYITSPKIFHNIGIGLCADRYKELSEKVDNNNRELVNMQIEDYQLYSNGIVIFRENVMG